MSRIPMNSKGNVAYVCPKCTKPMTKEQSIVTIISKSKACIPVVTYHYECKKGN